MNLQMVDLKGQYNKIQEEIDEAVLKVIRSTQFINGPEVKNFASNLGDYLNVKHVIPCANGTDALQIAMMALDLKPGDEVITPSFTYVATVEVIALLGLKPVFIDVDQEYFVMDINKLESLITSKTKAIVPVHLYGQCAQMEEILQIASKHKIAVIEDAAQAIGSDYIYQNGNRVKAGTMGNIGCTSFFPSKNLGCYGDGGALWTNDDEIAGKIKMIANHGQSKRYYHDIIGVNSRLDTIQAAVLNIKLKHLDEYVKARQKVAETYNQAFAGLHEIRVPKTASWSTHSFHQYTVKLKDVDREKLENEMKALGIPTNIYYPLPVHKQKAYSNISESLGLENTEILMNEVLSFPIHTEMDNDTLKYIISGTLQSLEASKKMQIQ